MQRADRKRSADVEAHRYEPPSDPSEMILGRNGSRQLFALHPAFQPTLGLLLTSDIYTINQRLRSGASLQGSCGAIMDYYGFASQADFVEQAKALFADLGSEVRLDESLTVYRGVGLPDESDPQAVEIAGLVAHITHGHSWESYFTEKGFGYASPHEGIAGQYDSTETYRHGTLAHRIVFELEISSGLCIPQAKYRCKELFEHTWNDSYLRKSMSQVVFAPNTEWKITDVVPGSEGGTTRVKMTQVWPKWR